MWKLVLCHTMHIGIVTYGWRCSILYRKKWLKMIDKIVQWLSYTDHSEQLEHRNTIVLSIESGVEIEETAGRDDDGLNVYIIKVTVEFIIGMPTDQFRRNCVQYWTCKANTNSNYPDG